MRKSTIWTIVIILVVIIAIAVYATSRTAGDYSLTGTSTPEENANVVSYSCDGGKTITATYGSSSVALVLSDGRNLTLPQTISGSGIRYAEGSTTFSSEGDDAFLEDGDQMTYSDCVAGTSSSNASGMETYTDQSKTFSFEYPADFTVSGGGVGYTTDWSAESTSSGLVLVKVSAPQSFEPDTNLMEADFTVGTSADPAAVASCLAPAEGSVIQSSSTVTINGVTYTKLEYGDAGAGNFYDTTSYRTVRNSQCYAVEYTIHSTDIGNYSPDQGITEFDKAKIVNALEGMVQSFKWL